MKIDNDKCIDVRKTVECYEKDVILTDTKLTK